MTKIGIAKAMFMAYRHLVQLLVLVIGMLSGEEFAREIVDDAEKVAKQISEKLAGDD